MKATPMIYKFEELIFHELVVYYDCFMMLYERERSPTDDKIALSSQE